MRRRKAYRIHARPETGPVSDNILHTMADPVDLAGLRSGRLARLQAAMRSRGVSSGWQSL